MRLTTNVWLIELAFALVILRILQMHPVQLDVQYISLYTYDERRETHRYSTYHIKQLALA